MRNTDFWDRRRMTLNDVENSFRHSYNKRKKRFQSLRRVSPVLELRFGNGLFLFTIVYRRYKWHAILGAIKMKRNVVGVVSALTRKQSPKIVVQLDFNQVNLRENSHIIWFISDESYENLDPYGLGMGRASTVSNASLVRLHDFFLKVKSVSTPWHKSFTQNGSSPWQFFYIDLFMTQSWHFLWIW